MLVFRSNNASTNLSLPIFFDGDPLLANLSPGSINFLFDVGYGGESPVSNGAALTNRVPGGSAGSVAISTAGTLTRAGGGYNFGGLTTGRAGLTGLALSGYQDDQNFLVCFYLKLPTEANWNGTGNILPFFHTAPENSAFVSSPDLVTIAQQTGLSLTARRQTGASTSVTTNLNVPSAAFGQIAQLAFFRAAGVQSLRLTTVASGSTQVNTSAATNNTQTVATTVPKWGCVSSYWSASSLSRDFTLYRGWVENLAVSGRAPLAVLADDWTRVLARGAFS